MKENIIRLSPVDTEAPLYIPMVGVVHWEPAHVTVRQCAPQACIEYVLSGNGTIEIDGHVFQPTKGDSFIFPMYSNYTCKADSNDPWVRMWMDVRGKLANEMLQLYGIKDVYYAKSLNLLPLFNQIAHTALDPNITPVERNLQMHLYYYEMVQEIALHVQKDRIPISDEAQVLKEYIDRNVSTTINIKELAALIYRSPSQTVRIFKNAFQCTPYEYASNLKIETAKLYLKSSSFKIREIAAQVGFANEHYFSTVFHAKTGLSPKEFRNS